MKFIGMEMNMRKTRSSFLVLCLAIAAIGLHAVAARAAVWENSETWNESWEEKYRHWIESEWTQDYFVKAGPLSGLKADCADVVYAMRIVFAAEHGLPFVMKDPTTRSSERVISNSMTRWDQQEPGQRLRSFLTYVYGIGSTASIPADTYPVAIRPSTLGAGSLILTDRSTHHSWTIKNFSNTGIPYLLFGSRPARALLYERNEYPTVGFVFPKGIRPETNAGFRNFRQPQDIAKAVHEVPGYSLEQYSLPTKGGWMRAVQKRMQKIEETSEQYVNRILAEACKGARERVDIIHGGVKKAAEIGSRCMTAQEYDDHSTPSRDTRVKGTFEELQEALNEGMAAGTLTERTQKDVGAIFDRKGDDTVCPVEIKAGTFLSLGQIYVASTDGKLSNNPHDTLEMRWGLQAGPSAKARSCPRY
ncbi:MAG: hypothetical protein RBT63_09370 [Bdellovibrionales bacterium]|jgi:hypothetical protein|nr:hypothetical protein [Bdellovibrionales bacterium]